MLTARTFDVLVVGGGIYGLTIACDAAQRGLAVALVERDDFGSGASFNHLRTIHGGLRYLQSLDFARARESVRERRDDRADRAARGHAAALRAAPLSIADARQAGDARRLRCSTASSPPAAIAACRSRIGCRGGRVFGRGTAIQRFPGLKRQGLTGAAVWHDYVDDRSRPPHLCAGRWPPSGTARCSPTTWRRLTSCTRRRQGRRRSGAATG